VFQLRYRWEDFAENMKVRPLETTRISQVFIC